MGIRSMIARCMERMRSGACATCDNRQYCPAGQWSGALAANDQAEGASPQLLRLGTFLERLGSAMTRRASASTPFAGRVETALSPLIAAGDASISRVAKEMGVSRQTVYRRLRAEGTSFEDLLTAKRRELAIHYLGVERVPVKVAAWKLGFSSPEAFSRAFKRWTGVSPGRFR